jgi:predicted nucleotidyltransferase
MVEVASDAYQLKPDNIELRKARLEKELARYVRLLATHRHPEKVIVFGSLASGDVHAWSDIDLVVVESTNLPFIQRLRQIRDLLQPTIATDILVYTPEELEQMRLERPFVREEILNKGRIVYERSD